MPTTTANPTSVFAGSHQREPALPVDGSVYSQPAVLGVDVAGYLGGDSNANADQPAALALPDVGAAPGVPALRARSFLTYNGASATSHSISYPTLDINGQAYTIPAGAYIAIYTAQAENLSSYPAVTSSGFTQHYYLHNATPFRQGITKLWKSAAGGESGPVTLNVAGGGSRLHAVMEIWENVDTSDPHAGITPQNQISGGSTNPNPPSLTGLPANAVMKTILAANIFPGGGGGFNEGTHGPAGYTLAASDADEERFFINYYKLIPAGGTEDPGIYNFTFDNFNVVSEVLRPAAGADLSVIVVTAVADETETASIGVSDPPVLAGVNEVQRLDSVLGAGTFTLTFDGQTTGAIDFDATAAEIDTALEALSNIGAGDVTCTGGPLNTNPVLIEFTGARAASGQPAISSSSGSVVVSTPTPGYAPETFDAWEGNANVPRSGGTYSPQLHFWSLDPAAYATGRPVDITVADHNALHTWAAALLVVERALISNPIGDSFGNQMQAAAAKALTFGDITPGTAGARLFAVLAKASSTHYTGAAALPTAPRAGAAIAEAEADAMTLSVFETPPVDDGVAFGVGTSTWAAEEDAASVVVALTPASGAGSLSTVQVLDPGAADAWLEIGAAVGAFYEVIEVDMSWLASGAFITGAAIEFTHSSDVRSPLRVTLAGIDGTGTLRVAGELRTGGYFTASDGSESTVDTGAWTEIDGSPVSDFDRLAVVLISSARPTGLTSHKVSAVSVTVDYIEGGPVVSGVTGPDVASAAITWDYTSSSGLPQTHTEVRILAGAGRDPEVDLFLARNALDPLSGEILYSSGQVAGSLGGALSLADIAPLARGPMTVAVRAWARLPNGQTVASDWATDTFDIAGDPPAVAAHPTDPVFNPDKGGVDLELVAPAGVSRAWLARSIDGGVTWSITPPFSVVASTTQTVTCLGCPLQEPDVRYQASYDDGPMTETTAPVDVGGSISTTGHEGWYFVVPSDPDLTIHFLAGEIAGFSTTLPKGSTVIAQPEGSIVASSPPLPALHTLSVRCFNEAQRLALIAAIDSQAPMRLINVLGREWRVRPYGNTVEQLQRAQPLASETTGLRDFHVYDIELAEIATPSTRSEDTGAPSFESNASPFGVNGSWSLVFEDTFDTDLSQWERGWYGEGHTEPVNTLETCCYGATQATVFGGRASLLAEATVDPLCLDKQGAQADYESGLINSRNSFVTTYGFFEARIHIPADAAGTPQNWPAWWLNNDTLVWPLGGEIDIMEVLEDGLAKSTYHYDSGGHQSSTVNAPAGFDPTGWHVYGCHWQFGRIDIYYDGVLIGSHTTGVSSEPMYMVLNQATADAWNSVAPSEMLVDYVRVWKQQ